MIEVQDHRAKKEQNTLNTARSDPKALTVLLTGASGVLGEALVERLGQHRLICLAHRALPEREDVEVVHGDLSRPLLGLDNGGYDELVRSVDCIVHAGAVTDIFASPSRIREANVGGTGRVVELARASGARLVYISSAFVATGIDTADGADGRRVHEGAKAYIGSKRAAEALVVASGVPHVVVRTSIIAGDAGTGEIGKLQGLHAVLGLLAEGTLPMLPVLPEGRVDFLPRDLVADVVCSLVDSAAAGSLWLTAGRRAPTVAEVVETAARFGREIGNDARVPRFIEPDAVDRLIRPVFLSRLPDDVRAELERLFALFSLVEAPEPFPSSLAELGVEPPDPIAVLEANLRFWATSELKPAAGLIPERASDLERWLVAQLASRRPNDDGGGPDPTTPFADLGLDSVEAAGIAADMESAFGQRVAVQSFYDHGNARQLARFLADEREIESPRARTRAAT
jgi:thioester reductase-like protein/acyl carrier protein